MNQDVLFPEVRLELHADGHPRRVATDRDRDGWVSNEVCKWRERHDLRRCANI